jgi:hypothetical protein
MTIRAVLHASPDPHAGNMNLIERPTVAKFRASVLTSRSHPPAFPRLGAQSRPARSRSGAPSKTSMPMRPTPSSGPGYTRNSRPDSYPPRPGGAWPWTARHSKAPGRNSTPGRARVRLFSALTHAEGVVVGQRKIPENTGEQAQMIPLLDQVAGAQPDGQALGDLSGVVVTADALCRVPHNALMPTIGLCRLRGGGAGRQQLRHVGGRHIPGLWSSCCFVWMRQADSLQPPTAGTALTSGARIRPSTCRNRNNERVAVTSSLADQTRGQWQA